MATVKKLQKGGCLSTTGSGTRTSIYKSAAGEGGSIRADGKAARQFARAERKMDKAQAKMDREESEAKAKAAPSKEMKKGGLVKKAKSGGSFPDLNKDGKVTKADILKGRGVIAKKGAMIKKVGKAIVAKKIIKSIKKK